MKIMQISVKLPLFPPVFVNLLVLCFLMKHRYPFSMFTFIHFLKKCSLQVLIDTLILWSDMIMSIYAARMHVLKCFLLRNHSIQQKLQVLTVHFVKFLPNCSQRSQD